MHSLTSFSYTACCAVGLWTSSLAANPSGGPQQAASESGTAQAARRCDQENALSALACEFAIQLAPLESVAVISLTSALDTPPTKPSEAHPRRASALAARLSKVVAGKLGASDLGVAETLAQARSRAKNSRHVLVLTPRVNGPRLDVTADLHVVIQSFWDRVKSKPRGPIAHAFGSRRIDAEIRSFFRPTPLVVTRTDKAHLPSAGVLALSCGDLDGDGSLELALSSRHELMLGTLRQGRLVVRKRVTLDDLSPISAHPLREPIGSLSITSGRYLDIGSTDREYFRRLDPELTPTLKRTDVLPWPGVGCVERSGLGLDSALQSCSGRQIAPALEDTLIDSLTGSRYQTQEGVSVTALAVRRLDSAQLELSDSRKRKATLLDAGAQVAIGDLNLDGSPEVLVSRNTLQRSEDGVLVYSWNDAGLDLAFSMDVPSGVDALALCPHEDVGLAPFAIATGDRIWVVR